MLQNCLLFDILVIELKGELCLDTITDALFVLHRLNLKNQLMMTYIQYVVMNLCKDFGALLLQFLTVADFIQPTTESRCIIIL
jgi:hypothetical protein